MDSRHGTPRFALFLVVFLTTLAAIIAAPTAIGSRPIYLDESIANNSTLNDVGDVRRAFERTSIDHEAAGIRGTLDYQAVSYRPITMASIALIQSTAHTFAAHRVFSIFLHVLTGLLVGLAVRKAKRPDWLAFLAAGVVVGHPAAVEAWVWVGGRADLLGGLCLAALALAVPFELGDRPYRRIALGSVILLVGALSKETFIAIAPAIFLRGAFQKSVAGRTRLAMVLATAIPLAVAWAIRTKVVHFPPAVPFDVTDVKAWLMRSPRLLSDASATLVLPWHRPMRTLAFELVDVADFQTIVGAIALGLAVASAAIDRRAGLFMVLLGSIVALIPTAQLGDSFWLGFDRFLYMPLVALAIVSAEAWESAPARSPALDAVAFVGIGLLVAVANVQATDLRTPKTLIAAIHTARPTDPSGSILRAEGELRETRYEEAAHTLEIAPTTSIPAIEGRRATIYAGAHRLSQAVDVIDALIAQQPDDAFAAKDAMIIALARSRWTELPTNARIARRRPGARRLACMALGSVADGMKRAPSDTRQPYQRAFRALRCELGVHS